MTKDAADLVILDPATGKPPPVGRPARRRDSERYRIELQVNVHSDHNFYAGLSENISEGGLFVATHHAVSLGSRIDLELALPALPAPLRVQGEVRWVRTADAGGDGPPGVGIRFLDLTPEAAEAIRAFIEQRAPEFFEED